MGRAVPILAGLVLAAHIAAVHVAALSYSLNTTCFKPKSLGGLGFCGPSACAATSTTKPACSFTGSTIDYAQKVASNRCRTCSQSSLPQCSTAALKAVIAGSGVKAAYCTEAHLVIISDGTPTWTPNLDDTPNPPGSTQVWKIPLSYTLLPTAAASNNLAGFPDGAADSSKGYMSSASGTYGLPTRGAVGVSVSGQEIFPVYNNRAELTPDSCEADSCNEHVGGGGGQPHLHGDPFGSWCLYSEANYTSLDAHPPQIGWSLDGPVIYGRYLSTAAPGYGTLDDCGGHEHGSYGYHYHAQVFDAVTEQPAHGMATGLPYAATTPGVFKCWRANISALAGFWADGQSSMAYTAPCCGTTKYYAAAGIVIDGAAAPPPSPPGSVSAAPPPPGATPGGGGAAAPPPPPSPGGAGRRGGAARVGLCAATAALLVAVLTWLS